MHPSKARRIHFGQSSTPYGTSLAGDPYGTAVPGCATPCAPSVIGNAGVPGCGTGTLPGSECHLKVVFRRSALPVGPQQQDTVEVLAGRGGAFKPRAVYMVGISSADPSINARFEILDVRGMGAPQLINYNGGTSVAERGITDFFNLQCMPQPVDWQMFGASQGQGLQVTVFNPEPAQGESALFYIAVWGDAATEDLLGKA